MSQSQESRIKINEAFVPYLNNHERYLVLYGGSGSGKSVFAAQKTIIRIATENNHRILCIRKVANTLRSSVYQIILDTINSYGLKAEFEVNKTEMRFTHRATGNEILLAGIDDVEKLKSIAGITSIWIEEATELTADDIDQIDLRLRGETDNYKQIIISFNPIDERHWLKARYFDRQNSNTAILKTTFLDNAFIDEEYRRVLEEKASLSPNLYRIYYLGEWGREEVKRPYCQNFSVQKHVSDRAVFNPSRRVIFSLDFNVEPFVCLAQHIWDDAHGMHFHTFDEVVIEKNGSVPDMCDRLLNQFGPMVMSNALFTGDAMQRKREIVSRDNIHAWKMIDDRFKLGRRLMVPPANPKVAENRHIVNAVDAFHPDNIINPKCKKLIYDCQYAECDEEGNLIKKDRNKDAERLDALDCRRYTINVFLKDFFTRYSIKK